MLEGEEWVDAEVKEGGEEGWCWWKGRSSRAEALRLRPMVMTGMFTAGFGALWDENYGRGAGKREELELTRQPTVELLHAGRVVGREAGKPHFIPSTSS
jgi:hypothetical protein